MLYCRYRKGGDIDSFNIWERIEMETETMEKTKEIEETRKRLERAKENGYYVQAFLAEVEFRKLLY